ncbi:hypothetical protein EDC01DRAFT_632285 [Geopyxis carbonaria]|nr:hypothetical protein EDC01DRAFT_632285 [Geopyxis carbonaria]
MSSPLTKQANPRLASATYLALQAILNSKDEHSKKTNIETEKASKKGRGLLDSAKPELLHEICGKKLESNTTKTADPLAETKDAQIDQTNHESNETKHAGEIKHASFIDDATILRRNTEFNIQLAVDLSSPLDSETSTLFDPDNERAITRRGFCSRSPPSSPFEETHYGRLSNELQTDCTCPCNGILADLRMDIEIFQIEVCRRLDQLDGPVEDEIVPRNQSLITDFFRKPGQRKVIWGPSQAQSPTMDIDEREAYLQNLPSYSPKSWACRLPSGVIEEEDEYEEDSFDNLGLEEAEEKQLDESSYQSMSSSSLASYSSPFLEDIALTPPGTAALVDDDTAEWNEESSNYNGSEIALSSPLLQSTPKQAKRRIAPALGALITNAIFPEIPHTPPHSASKVANVKRTQV